MEKDKEKKEEVVQTKQKKDLFAIWSFVLGLTSSVFAWIGVIPLFAIILGVISMGNTKEKGTGRWMAVSGVILGVVFLISNIYMNLDAWYLDNQSEETSLAPSSNSEDLKQQNYEKTSEAMGGTLQKVNKDKHSFIIEVTNISDQTIKGYKGKYCFRDVFNEVVRCDEMLARYEPLAPNESYAVKGYYGIGAFDSSDLWKILDRVESYDSVYIDVYDKEIIWE